MQPFRPEVRQSIIDNGFGTEEEIEEYYQLLAEKFSKAPASLPNSDISIDTRIENLYRKFFPVTEEPYLGRDVYAKKQQ